MSKTKPKAVTVKFPHPISRSDKTIDSVELRVPMASELRGLTLSDLMRMDASSTCVLVPRISSPILTKEEMAAMHPANLLELAATVAGFLLPEDQLEAVSQ
jgi:hypothetical protein